MFKENRFIYFQKSTETFYQAVEAKDFDDKNQDELLGGVQDTTLDDMKKKAGDSLVSIKNNLKSLLRPEDEKSIKQDIEHIFQNREKEIEGLDRINDTEIEQLLFGLYNDLQTYEEFKTEALEIDYHSEYSFELMSNVDKKIARIDFQYQSQRDLATLISADKAFDTNVDFTIAIRSGENLDQLNLQGSVDDRHMESGRKVKIITLDEYSDHSAYSRDPRVVFGDGKNLHAEKYTRMSLKSIKGVTDALGVELEVTQEIYFEGGNLRATNNILYVGIDDIVRTVEINDQVDDKNEAIKLFEEKFKKKIVIVGEFGAEKQPSDLFHIDLFITPLSDNEVIIAQLPKDHEHYQYIEDVTEELAEKMPHLKIHRLETPVFSDAIITFNNMLVENVDLPDGTKERRIYIPKYLFSSYLQGQKDFLIKLHEEYLPRELKQLSRNPSLEFLQERVDNTKNEIKNTEAEIALISGMDTESFNQYIIDQIESFSSEDSNTIIKQVEVDIQHLLSWRGKGGSLNCLTNEYRSDEN